MLAQARPIVYCRGPHADLVEPSSGAQPAPARAVSRLVARRATPLLRRLFAFARWIDRRDPKWLAWLSPRLKRRWAARLWRPLARRLPEVHRLDGFELRVPAAMRSIAVIQPYEPATRRLLEELIRPGDRVVDVGANIGLLTTVMARAVGSRGRVWAVEPDADNLALLAENLGRNGLLDRVEIVAAAAGRRREQRRLHRATSGARHSFHREGEPGGPPPVEVASVPLDEVVSGVVHLVKIDVEGAEIEALDGMAELLAREPRPQLVVEWCPQGAEGAGHGPADLPRGLSLSGYDVRLISECDGPGDLAAALARVAAGGLRDGWYANLHAVPRAVAMPNPSGSDPR